MTGISYPDLFATSPGGLRLAEALSPDNGSIPYPPGTSEDTFGRRYGQFQGNFCYRLLDGAAVLWERWQPSGEPSPRELCVADDGWLVARVHDNGYSGLRALDPSGRLALDLTVASRWSTTRGDRLIWIDEHVSDTTAGPWWAHHSLPLFVSWEERPFFSYRTWWGRRIVVELVEVRPAARPPVAARRRRRRNRRIQVEPLDDRILRPDVRACRLLDELPDALLEAIMAAEHRAALTTLAGAVERGGVLPLGGRDEADEGTDRERRRRDAGWERHRLHVAVHVAGMSRLLDAAEALRWLEPRSSPSGATGTHAFGEDGIWVTASWPVVLVQQALRRLGLPPGPYDAYRFARTPFVDRAGPDDFLPMAPPERGVLDRWARLDRAMGPAAVLLSLGSPSFVGSSSERRGECWAWREIWEYDVGAGNEGKTLRITWGPATPGHILETCELPPAWEGAGRPLLG